MASSNGFAIDSDAAYSICRTLLGISVCDFDDACTSRGLIARTPPFGTVHSTGGVCDANSWMLSSLSTPRVCVPRKTRRGPFPAVESSSSRVASAPGPERPPGREHDQSLPSRTMDPHPHLADPSAPGEAMQYPRAPQPANSPPVIYQIEWREREMHQLQGPHARTPSSQDRAPRPLPVTTAQRSARQHGCVAALID